MRHTSGCVWIDHREARIFGLSVDDADEIVVHDAHAPQHIHRRADHVHLGKEAPNTEFFADIAGKLGGFRRIVIVGPGVARTEFAGYLTDTHPALAKRSGASKRWTIRPTPSSSPPRENTSAPRPACTCRDGRGPRDRGAPYPANAARHSRTERPGSL